MLTRPLRFAMVTTFYPPYCMDADGYDVQRWARALTARGHTVDVIHDTDAYRLLTGHVPEIPFEDDGIRIHRLRSPTKFMSSLGVQQLGRPTTHRERLEELLVGRYDVIHYHNISLIGGPGVWKIGTGIKLHTAHDFWLSCASHTLWRDNKELCDAKRCLRCVYRQGRPPQLWRNTRKMERSASHVDAFLVPSHSAANVHEAFGFKQPMRVAPPISAISAPRLKSATNTTSEARGYFFYSGPLNDAQGVADIITHFPTVLDAELRIAGIGTDEASLRRLAEDRENILFLGRLSEDEIREQRRNAIAIFAPQRGYEVFSNAILEAFREGKPVIARSIGANEEVINSSGGGLLFSDVSQLETHISVLATDVAYCAELGRKAFSYFAQHWREDVAIDTYFGIIRDIAEEKGLSDLITKIDDMPSRFTEQGPALSL